jgi:peptidyl-prolyl cis-trans isomerase A (cyclophilin A)
MKISTFLAVALLAFSTAAIAANPEVELKTSMGTITLELYPNKAPKTVENFLQYVKDGHYKGTIFHRVIPGFMIQAGGFTNGFVEKKTRDSIPNEARNGLRNNAGTVAMARRGDPDSATAQFFINVVDNEGLNRPNPDGHGYAVFGKVIKGMDVVKKIEAVDTGSSGPHQNVPRKQVVIEEARIVSADKPAAK